MENTSRSHSPDLNQIQRKAQFNLIIHLNTLLAFNVICLIVYLAYRFIHLYRLIKNENRKLYKSIYSSLSTIRF